MSFPLFKIFLQYLLSFFVVYGIWVFIISSSLIAKDSLAFIQFGVPFNPILFQTTAAFAR